MPEEKKLRLMDPGGSTPAETLDLKCQHTRRRESFHARTRRISPFLLQISSQRMQSPFLATRVEQEPGTRFEFNQLE